MTNGSDHCSDAILTWFNCKADLPKPRISFDEPGPADYTETNASVR
jgi:hypothetical protein